MKYPVNLKINNKESHPLVFMCEDGEHIVSCGYDYMGRRSMKKVTVNGAITLHHRYIYRGYLQIACVDLTRNGHPALWLTMWDPSEPVATRPLAIQKNATWYSYGHNLTKNITELYNTNGTIATVYDYSPYRAVTSTGTDQPFQWSSEFYDAELGLVYYNYRHYNPMDGRWINRDPLGENEGSSLYEMIDNNPVNYNDYLGLEKCCDKLTGKEVDYDPKVKCCNKGKIIKKQICKIYISVGCATDYNPEKFNKTTKGNPRIKGSCVTCGRLDNCNRLNAENRVPDHNKTRNNAWLFPNIDGQYKNHSSYNPNRGDTTVQEGLDLELANAKKEAKQMCDSSESCCSKVEIRIVSQGENGGKWLNNNNYVRNNIYETIQCN